MDQRQQYDSLADALAVARENSDAVKRLAALGWGHTVVAQVLNIDGKFEVVSVVVRSEDGWQRTKDEHVVRSFQFGSLTCPVCDRVGSRQGNFRAGNLIGYFVDGLAPDTCGGCHDVMTNNGIAPTDYSTNPPSSVAWP